MMLRLAALLLAAAPLLRPTSQLSIALEPLGDSAAGVSHPAPLSLVIGTTFRWACRWSSSARCRRGRGGQALSAMRSICHANRYCHPDAAAGAVEIEARLMVPLEEQTPVIVARRRRRSPWPGRTRPSIARENEGAEAIMAEGWFPRPAGRCESCRRGRRGANLFVVDVEVKPPVKRVEFWVEGKKIFTRNAPHIAPSSTSGAAQARGVRPRLRRARPHVDATPRGQRARDAAGSEDHADHDADGVEHFKLSVQNPKTRR